MKKLLLLFVLYIFVLSSSFGAFPLYSEAAGDKAGDKEGLIYMQAVDAPQGYFVVEGGAGQSKSITINLENRSDEYQSSAVLLVSDATTANGGGMGVVSPDSAKSEKVGAWFDLIKKEISLLPGEKKDMTLNFTIPSDARSGDHIGVITLYKFMPAEEPEKLKENEARVLVNKAYSQSIAVLVKVPGPITHNLVLKSCKPHWVGADLFLDIEISNEGNVYEKSQGLITIFNGNEEIFKQDIQMNSIYPETTGVYSFLVPKEIKDFGEFKAKATLGYAEKETEETFAFNIKSKDVKQSKLIELADEKKQPIESSTILLTRDNLILIGIGILMMFIITILTSIVIIKKKRSA